MKALLTLGALSALFFASPVAAQSNTLTYLFTGNCEDCNPANTPATATLVLKDYQPGTQLSTSNLVSFTYDSNIVVWDSQNLGTDYAVELGLAGSLGTSSGSYDVYLHELTFTGSGVDFTTTQASFNYASIIFFGVPGGLDHGTGTWTLVSGNPGPVPEAATWMAMLGGFGMVGAAQRRRRAGAYRAG